MGKLIYVADDDAFMRNIIVALLENNGYTVKEFETGSELLAAFLQTPGDMVILDVIMPGESGIEVCTAIRKVSDVPIIMITACDEDEDYIRGIDSGSDEYYRKPFSAPKLLVRVKTLLARYERQEVVFRPSPPTIVNIGDLTIDSDLLDATYNNARIKLTGTEFKLLLHLAINKGRAVSREELLRDVWGYGDVVESRAADDAIKRLRRKLVNVGSSVVIDAVWGHGFIINDSNVEGVC